MDYISSNLMRGEKVLARAKISWLTLVGPCIGVVVCIIFNILLGKLIGSLEASEGAAPPEFHKIISILRIVLVIVGFLPLLRQIIINATTHLAVTNKRLIGKYGVLQVDAIDFPIQKVDNISQRATFFGKFFHFETIEVRGGGDKPRQIKGIANAAQFKNVVTEAIEMHAEEARKAQAAEIAAAMASK